jgi:hypothetical protein
MWNEAVTAYLGYFLTRAGESTEGLRITDPGSSTEPGRSQCDTEFYPVNCHIRGEMLYCIGMRFLGSCIPCIQDMNNLYKYIFIGGMR